MEALKRIHMFKNKSRFSSITVNGKTIKCCGKNISVASGNILVDGVSVSQFSENVKIIVNGDVEKIDCDVSVEVNGNSGTIDCGGSCSVGGNVSGNIDAGGSVTCGNVGGNIDAGGSVCYRR